MTYSVRRCSPDYFVFFSKSLEKVKDKSNKTCHFDNIESLVSYMVLTTVKVQILL